MKKTILLLALLSASTISQAQRFDDNFVSPKTQCNTYAGFSGHYDSSNWRCKLPVLLMHPTLKQRCMMHQDKYDGPDFVKVTTPQPNYGLLFVVSTCAFFLGLHYNEKN